jgi:hypothetical protein
MSSIRHEYHVKLKNVHRGGHISSSLSCRPNFLRCVGEVHQVNFLSMASPLAFGL